MYKIATSAILISLSFSSFSQTPSERRENEGACYQAAMEKASRTGLNSVDKNLMRWVSTNFDTANKIEALSKPGGKCVGAANDCFKRNLSQSEWDFAIGMARAAGFLASPQDPKRLPNIEVALVACFNISK
jgi:hypothetical protein